MKLKILASKYQVLKLNPNQELLQDIFNKEFYSITKTEEEISIVADNEINIQSDNVEKNWKIIKIEGVLDFSLIGILSKISEVLADNNISIFVVSTYNTDYILVKEDNIDKAKEVLINNHYHFE